MGKVKRALGAMSGTSMDGIDVALVTTDGESILTRGPSETYAYSPETRARLTAGLIDARSITTNRNARPGSLAAIETEITELHAAAVSAFRRKHKFGRADIDVIGFHGQTVLHRAPVAGAAGMTVQLGNGALLADLTALDVVHDMRAADVAAGGHGAPMVPVYHAALAAHVPQRPLAVLNIGGVANVTWIGRDGALVAFDTGPGNALIDDWMGKRAGQAFDEGGKAAAAGRVDEDVLRQYLSHAWFNELPPKSLDRNMFSGGACDGLSLEDGAATLAAFTAGAIVRAREHLREEPALWVIAGGGRRNAALMGMIAARVENAVVPAEALGLGGDAMEAEAWGYLAVRSLAGLPLTFPGTTGVSAPTTGGILARAPRAAV